MDELIRRIAAGAYPVGSMLPKEERLAQELDVSRGVVRECIRAAIETLPARQQAVIALRDVEGWSPEEVCEALALSEGNQRVLLHRARSRVRAELEGYLGDESEAAA